MPTVSNASPPPRWVWSLATPAVPPPAPTVGSARKPTPLGGATSASVPPGTRETPAPRPGRHVMKVGVSLRDRLHDQLLPSPLLSFHKDAAATLSNMM